MTLNPLEMLKRELDAVRARVDGLRVQANLGKKELRDAVEELRTKIEPGYEKAKKTLGEAAATGARESQAVAKSLMAGWDEVRRTYRSYSEKAKE
ncbi:MAG: hypothetical protein R3F34_02020 [Planctomycetota bacterium]